MEYAPGQILNENVLAKEFGINRTPMREVLYRLSWEQLARIIARTGTVVTQIEFQTMMHTYQTRLGIEGETVGFFFSVGPPIVETLNTPAFNLSTGWLCP